MKVSSKAQAVVGGLGQRQQFFARHQVDLVQHQDFRVRTVASFVQDRLGLLVDAALGVEQHADEIGVMRAAPCRRHHRAVEPALGREDAGRIDQDDLRVVFDHDAADQRARGLHLARDDRDLGADQRVDQRRLADIGRADQRDKAAARRAGDARHPRRRHPSLLPPPTPSRAIITEAAAFSAARLLPPTPSAGASPGSSTATRNCGS